MMFGQPDSGEWAPILYYVLTGVMILFNLVASGLTLYFEVLGQFFTILITAMFLWGVVMHIFGLITVINRRQPDPCQVRFVKISYVVQVIYAAIMFLILGIVYYMSSPRDRKLLLIVLVGAAFGTLGLGTVWLLYLCAIFKAQSPGLFYLPVKPQTHMPLPTAPYFNPNPNLNANANSYVYPYLIPN